MRPSLGVSLELHSYERSEASGIPQVFLIFASSHLSSVRAKSHLSSRHLDKRHGASVKPRSQKPPGCQTLFTHDKKWNGTEHKLSCPSISRFFTHLWVYPNLVRSYSLHVATARRRCVEILWHDFKRVNRCVILIKYLESTVCPLCIE